MICPRIASFQKKIDEDLDAVAVAWRAKCWSPVAVELTPDDEFGFSLFVLFDVIGVVLDAFRSSSRKLSPRIWHIRTETSAIFLGHPVLGKNSII